MSDSPYISRKDAAALCACNVSTIIRDERAGRIDHHIDDHGQMLVSVTDLVAIGRLSAAAVSGSVDEVCARTRAERDLIGIRRELAVEQARSDGLREQLVRAHEEVAFLRNTITNKVV